MSPHNHRDRDRDSGRRETTRIALLIGSLEQGGAQSMMLRIFDGLQRLGYDVYLLTLDGTTEVPLYGDRKRAEELSRRVIHLSTYNVKRSTLRKLFTVPLQWYTLERTLRRLQCMQVVSFMDRANIFNLVTLVDVRRIISIRKHFSTGMRTKSRLKRGLIKLVYPIILRRAEGINFNANQSAEDFCSLFSIDHDKISVIYNYCDHELIARLARASIPESYQKIFENPVVITSGRLLGVKGHAYLIRAFKTLKDAGDKHTQLVILGEGPLRKELQRLARELAIEDAVHFPGYQSNPYPWLAKSELFVLPSLTEGFPNALLEAMALGVPAISADCPSGPRELLAEDELPLKQPLENVYYAPYGVLIPRLDREAGDTAPEQDLSTTIMELLNNDTLRSHYQEAAYNRASHFSEDRCLHEWKKLFEKMR